MKCQRASWAKRPTSLWPYPAALAPGEVLVRVRGGSESYIAYADEPVDEGVQVVILADRGARSLMVVPL